MSKPDKCLMDFWRHTYAYSILHTNAKGSSTYNRYAMPKYPHTNTKGMSCYRYEITREFMQQNCKIDKTYGYANGAKIHKMNDSCILEGPDGKLTLYIGMFQHVFDQQRALNTKKPELKVQVKK